MRLINLTFAALLLCGCNPPIPDKITLGMDEAYYGYIDTGSKFGVSIGMSRQESRAVLVAAGQNDPDEAICKLDDRFACTPGDVYDRYYWSANVPSERNKKIDRRTGMKYGWIKIFVKDENVTAIGWSFYNSNIDP